MAVGRNRAAVNGNFCINTRVWAFRSGAVCHNCGVGRFDQTVVHDKFRILDS